MTTQNGAGFSLSNCVVFFELVGLAYSNLGSIDFIMDANLNYVIKLFIDMINTASLQFEICDLLGMQLLANIKKHLFRQYVTEYFAFYKTKPYSGVKGTVKLWSSRSSFSGL